MVIRNIIFSILLPNIIHPWSSIPMKPSNWLRHLNFASLRRFFVAIRHHRLYNLLIDLVAMIWFVLWQTIFILKRKVQKRTGRFFAFFTYLNWSTWRTFARRTGQKRLYGLAAEIAFNAMLALFPALLAVIAAIGLSQSLQSTLYQMALLLGEVVPDEVKDVIGNLIEQIVIARNPQLLSVGFIGAIWIYSGAISATMNALDQIHQVPHHLMRPFWQAKLVSIAIALGMLQLLILASGLVLLSDLIIEIIARKSCLLETIPNCSIEQITICLQQPPVQNCLIKSTLLDTWELFRWPMTLGIVSLAFGFIYRYGPSRRSRRIPIMPGAMMAAILWALISNLFRIYVMHFGNYNWTFGAIGTFIILQLWLHLSSFAMLLGEELNVTVGELMEKRLN